jgi:hypothetical protein
MAMARKSEKRFTQLDSEARLAPGALGKSNLDWLLLGSIFEAQVPGMVLY